MDTHSPNMQKKFKQKLSARKLIAAVLWDRKGVLMVEFMREGTIIKSETYCETLNSACIHSEKKAWNADTRCSASS
jgi:hypothetical protein